MSALEYVNPIYNALRIVSKDRTPRQLAMAVALGMMIGLLPKGNLLAAGFTFLLLTLRVNLGVGLTTAFLVTLFSGSIDPLTHGIGLRMLRHPSVYPLLSQLHQYPVVPWLSLNNSVVLGSFILGVGLFYPTYHGSERAFQRIVPALTPKPVPGPKEADAGEGQVAGARIAEPARCDNATGPPTDPGGVASGSSVASAPATPVPTSLTPSDLLAALADSTNHRIDGDSSALTRPPLMTRATLPTRKMATLTAAADRLRRAMPPEPAPLPSFSTEASDRPLSSFSSLLPNHPSAGPLAAPPDRSANTGPSSTPQTPGFLG